MSIETEVLYGNRLYDAPTYSTNQDPESLSANLADSATLTDTGFQFLADALSILENAITVNGIKRLADSMSMTEAQLISAVKLLTDSTTVTDAVLHIAQIKALTDFIVVKDWVSLNLDRADIWQTTPAFGFNPSNIHCYGANVYYAVDFYSHNPTVNWLLQTLSTTTWQMQSSTEIQQSLYAQTYYGASPFSSTGTPGWTKPVATGQQAWTNANGESHN